MNAKYIKTLLEILIIAERNSREISEYQIRIHFHLDRTNWPEETQLLLRSVEKAPGVSCAKHRAVSDPQR